MVEWWCGVRTVERWYKVILEQFCGVTTLEWWCGVSTLEWFCGVRAVGWVVLNENGERVL